MQAHTDTRCLKQYVTMNKLYKVITFFTAFMIGVFAAMYFCYTQPLDESILIVNRHLNWPQQECYSQSDLELIIYGEIKYE